MTKGQTCFSQEYCTNCPLRAECGIRPLFYSDSLYNEYRDRTLRETTTVAKSLGLPETIIPIGINIGLQMMDKRRSEEIRIHPIYSIK